MRFALALMLSLTACTGPNLLATLDGDAGDRTTDGGLPDGATSDGGAPDGGGCVPVEHRNGFLDYSGVVPEYVTWTDCVPRRTYDQAQAIKACESYRAWAGVSATCVPIVCDWPTLPAVGAIAVNKSSGAKCGVWVYEGGTKGHVGDEDTLCRCPDVNSPSWD